MRRFLLKSLFAAGLSAFVLGCRSVRPPEVANGPHFKVLTYNVNWGGPRPDLAAEAIRKSGADIVCLQETSPEWAEFLRRSLGSEYSFTAFRDSRLRSGGGLGFLSKLPAHEVAYIPSDTDWFDGWIMSFETAKGPVQVLNVHLHPPVSESGSWVSGYLFTGGDRLAEIKRFYAERAPQQPMLVMGDFNDGEKSPAVEWLEKNKMANALPEFDSYTKTWEWHTSMVTLKRRMDHILYSSELHCCSAEVLREGASDHFPVEAVFTKSML